MEHNETLTERTVPMTPLMELLTLTYTLMSLYYRCFGCELLGGTYKHNAGQAVNTLLSYHVRRFFYKPIMV